MSKLSDLQQARVSWFLNLWEGGYCPVCARWGKEYRRGINKTMALSVWWLCEQESADPDGWIDVPNTAPKWILRSNQLPTMKWWGMVERLGNSSEDGELGKNKHSGMWRPTQLGRDFIYGGLAVPKFAYTYNDTVTRMSDELVTFTECDKRFSYAEIMDGAKLSGSSDEGEP